MRLLKEHWCWLSISLIAALVIRLLVLPLGFFGYDLRAFTEWMSGLQTAPLDQFYAQQFTVPQDHLPGTLWILWAVGHVLDLLGVPISGEHPFFAIKLVGMMADLANGILLFALGLRLGGTRAARLASLGYLFNPAFIFISAYWGQWDAVSLIFLLAALLCCLDKRFSLSIVFLAVGMVFKPQFVILAPLIASWCFGHRYVGNGAGLRELIGNVLKAAKPLISGGIASAILLTVIGLPFQVGLVPGLTTWTYWERVQFATDRYNGTTFGALGIWLIPAGTIYPPKDTEAVAGVISYGHIGYGLALIVLAASVWLMYRLRWSPLSLICAATVTYWGFGIFATRLHERYLLPAVALAIVLAASRSAYAPVALVLSTAFSLNMYLAFTYVDWNLPFAHLRTHASLAVLSVITILAFCWLVIGLYRPLFAPVSIRFPGRALPHSSTLSDNEAAMT